LQNGGTPLKFSGGGYNTNMKSDEAKKIEASLKAYVQQLRQQIAENVAIIKQSRKNLDNISRQLTRLKDAQSRRGGSSGRHR
jgi:uncharacterized protein involved in exopolysaccharide biosynthesis